MTLAGKYEDDALYRLIQQAKRNPETTSLATHLQGELTQYWITMKKDPGEIYRKFQLDEIQSKKDIFNKPEFAAWVNYADQLSVTYPGLPVSKTSTLTKFFLLTMIFSSLLWP
ncbi:hypothetical protein L916_12821 [Phytophthora nicotianae]|uniref:RXLR phytopathogen effector protein WY-domain domain-containing protein n=1 Tax=Phytophthora nicotianae TaxID=4792 RepID=W2ILJ9_PHYNI|nr:hypothetical protein L916_12821 [Phytophthora nicotianae]